MGLDLTGIGSVADLVGSVVGKIWPDPTKAAEAKIALLQAEQAGAFKELDAQVQIAVEQIKADAAEAAQPGLHFRDGAGWVCVVAFALAALKAPIEWAAALAGHPVTLPAVDTSITTSMLLGLLGLGGMHLAGQIKGVS